MHLAIEIVGPAMAVTLLLIYLQYSGAECSNDSISRRTLPKFIKPPSAHLSARRVQAQRRHEFDI